tara:strand:+ start:545 stop:1162 length:618 start_codon:yes stop_codon:yes gene_type:complete
MSIVKLNNRGVKNVTAFGSLTSGSMTFIKKLTASSSSTLSFVNGSSSVVLDNTYKEYIFTFNNIHPATDNADIMINFSTDSGSNYNVAKTSTHFRALHDEADSATSLAYDNSNDMAQGTGDLNILLNIGNGNDECGSGYLHLFDPSSTTFVKHFIANMNRYDGADYTVNQHTAGYANTTSAIDAVKFQMDTGNMDAGDICLYGIN